jgi:hypothetical protein
MEAAGTGSKTAIPVLGTNDDKYRASSTPTYANGIFSPLDPIHPGSLEGRLDNFSRDNDRCHLLTVHLELCAGYRCLRRHALIIVQKFGLARAPRGEEHNDERQAGERPWNV